MGMGLHDARGSRGTEPGCGMKPVHNVWFNIVVV